MLVALHDRDKDELDCQGVVHDGGEGCDIRGSVQRESSRGSGQGCPEKEEEVSRDASEPIT